MGRRALRRADVEFEAEETQPASFEERTQPRDREAMLLHVEAEVAQQARAPEILPGGERPQPPPFAAHHLAAKLAQTVESRRQARHLDDTPRLHDQGTRTLTIEAEPQEGAGPQHRGDRLQTRPRIGHVMQHADALGMVEAATKFRQVENVAAQEVDVVDAVACRHALP